MPRIRRKIVIVVSTSVFALLLLMYLRISQSIATEKEQEHQPDSLFNSELRQKKQFIDDSNTIKDDGNHQLESQIIPIKRPIERHSLGQEGKSNFGLPNSVLTCDFRTDSVPTPDIQMLDVYESLKFDNPDGGVWKQGWKLDYDQHQWNAHHKLHVFVVPHSHNDPGWIKTFDEYYEQTTKAILNNMLSEMTEQPSMTFIWAEISYFARWFEEIPINQQRLVKSLIRSGRLEFVTGGWVMPDEANSHWTNVLLQLTEGQLWLKTHFNVTPISSWAIDPFGHSATMPYILKKSGFDNMLIQRTHYSVKKRLGQQKQLEFRWQQIWDSSGSSELFTHMMPFYSYDVPHTCGPDPKVCCQFDFKRLPGYGLSCPWKVSPKIIDDTNVAKRAELILDQWRKKSTLYRTRSVLIPLGDDFRYNQKSEWEAQRSNYEKLFEYMNNEPSLNVVAKFGTLQEYFDSVKAEQKASTFPALSGDFFTYADRDEHYWSGYYTSRPFHKRLDRILMSYIRSAEMLHAWTTWDAKSKFDPMIQKARRALSLFQHHDGVTGTAKDHVVVDYARQMNDALKACHFVIQQSVYRHLTKSSIYQPDYTFTYFNLDDSRTADQMTTRHTIILGTEIPTKYIVVHNSLPHIREELVEFFVSKPLVKVTDLDSVPIPAQISPVWSWHKDAFGSVSPQISTTKFKLIFRAKVPPLGLTTYQIHSTASLADSTETTFSKVTVFTDHTFPLPNYPIDIKFDQPSEVSLRTDDGAGASFTKHGTLKSLSLDSSSASQPIHLSFMVYRGIESGAYLFLPRGTASPIDVGSPTVIVVRGPFESSCTSGLPFAVHENILRGGALEIRNLVDIRSMDNSEIAMRVSSGIQSNVTFYTDLNGLQMVKRKRFKKLPLQANYYPVPSQIFIEDDTMRLTLLSGQPLGGSSLAAGQLEIMQDRRLQYDDNRGLGQGVLDNQPVLNIFRLVLENIEPCNKVPAKHPSGFMTSNVHAELQSLLYPMEKLIWHENEWPGVQSNFGSEREALDADMEVSVVRDLPHIRSLKSGQHVSSIGLVVHRTNLQKCKSDGHLSGTANIKRLLDVGTDRTVHASLITMLQRGAPIATDEVEICPMDISAFIVAR